MPERAKHEFRRGYQIKDNDVTKSNTERNVRLDVPDVPSVYIVEFDKNGKYTASRVK